VIIFLIITLQHITINSQKFKIIFKINPTHLTEIEQQIKKKTTKIQEINENIITITAKIQLNYF
jgi:hypothetical protein